MPPTRRSPLPWPSVALWSAIGLVVLRGVVRVADGLGQGLDAHAAAWDFGLDLFPVLCVALGAALVGLSPARYSGPARTARFALSAALCVYVLGGTHLEPAHARIWHQPWPLAAAVVPIGLAVAIGMRRLAATPRPLSASMLSPAGTGLPAVVGALLAGAYGWAFVRHPPTVESRVVGRELFADPSAWSVLVERPEPEAGARLEMVGPAFDSRQARPTIVLPPPATLELPITAQDERCRLRGRVAIDVRTASLVRGDERLAVRFGIHVDDELRFETTIETRAGDARNAWVEIVDARTNASGIELGPGDVVRLSTELASELPPSVSPAQLRCGFGKLQLETSERRSWQRARAELPNLVLIVQDTQRADRLGSYGYDADISPALDALAERGTLFEEAFATSSWTWPATASILTGELPERHGVTSNESCYLFASETTIAERLRERGYLTAAFTCNPLIVTTQNFDQGFDHFDDGPTFRKTDEILSDVGAWLREHQAARFFLYLHLADPHEPHRPLPRYAEQFGVVVPDDLPSGPDGDAEPEQAFNLATAELLQREHYDDEGTLLPEHRIPADHRRFYEASYDASVASGDHWVGAILAELERLGLAETTVVTYTSDHGEELFDHGLLAHGHSLHRELVRVPLVVAGPGIAQGVRVQEPVSNREVHDMLARLGGAPLERRGPRLEVGESGGPVLFSTVKGWWNGRSRQPLFGVRSKRWAYHWAPTARPWGADATDDAGEERLYDVRRDVGETRDASASHPEPCDTLLANIRQAIETARLGRRSAALGADHATLAKLAALGYVADEHDDDADDDE